MAEPRQQISVLGTPGADLEEKPKRIEDALDEAVFGKERLPGEGPDDLRLSDEHLADLAREVQSVIDAFDSSMQQRIRRWEEISDAYNLLPDAERQGTKPDASRLVSEMMRSKVTNASSRITSGVLGLEPFVEVKVLDSQGDDADTEQLVEEAKVETEFYSSYFVNEMKAKFWIPMLVQRAAKLGDCVVKASWARKSIPERRMKPDGRIEITRKSRGAAKVELIPLENTIVWPLWEPDIEELEHIGYRSFLSPSGFRQWALKKQIDKSVVKDVMESASAGDGRHESRDRDLRGHDVSPTERAGALEIEMVELWSTIVPPGGDEVERLIIFYHPHTQKILRLQRNPYRSQRHGFFSFPYMREEQFFYGSGVGHELVYPQAADSALMNLWIDNLKVIGNHVRIFRAGSMAEAMRDHVGPGRDIVTEDPETDIVLVALGGSLELIVQAMSMVDNRATVASGISPVLAGMGDPTLKSGASPSSIQQLIQQAGNKFERVDENIRESLSQLFQFIPELLAQYAPAELFYEQLSPENAAVILRKRHQRPQHSFGGRFRIVSRAPSAASNKEVLKQHLMLAYQMAVEQLNLMISAGPTIFEQNPAGLSMYLEKLGIAVNKILASILEQQDVPGLKGIMPDMGPPTSVEEVMNGLMMERQQLQQQLEQMQQQLQEAQMAIDQAMGGAPPMPPEMQAPPMGPPAPMPMPGM